MSFHGHGLQSVSGQRLQGFSERREISMDIYVGNLSFDTTERDLETAFAGYGAVTSARIATDRDTGRARGFGFVEMANRSEAQAAITGLNGKEMQGRSLVVNEARPRDNSGGRSGNRSGGGRARW
jgi:cold-inducible RNA-binding protein